MIRHEKVMGVGPWHWPEIDMKSQDGGLFVGPAAEFPRHKQLIQKYCKKTDVVVQAGGACGMYPRLLADFFKVVYTFEPHVYNFQYLVQNANLPHILKYQAALGDNHEMIMMNSISENQGMHQVAHVENAVIPTLMIDDFAFPDLDLIMLDIELYEIHALRGAKETIKKFKPIIVTENASKEIVDFLSQFGYKEIDTNVRDTYFGV